MHKHIETIQCTDWNDFKNHLGSLAGLDNYSFRGQRDANWSINSTLTRLANKLPNDNQKIEDTIKWAFERRIRGLRGSHPSKLDDNQLWSLGQHYGLATPLIDWSLSPYIAAYFAWENSAPAQGGLRSIYRINHGAIHKATGTPQEPFGVVDPLQDDNQRILAQAGLFLRIPTGTSLETWLTELSLTQHLIKLTIPEHDREQALRDLNLMNINAATLFPDLHGAAISCNMLIEQTARELERSR